MDYQKEQELRKQLAENLRRLRMARMPALSQKRLAEKLGVTQKSISRYENAKSLPPAHVLVAIAELFGLTTDALFMAGLSTNIKMKEGTITNENITSGNPAQDC